MWLVDLCAVERRSYFSTAKKNIGSGKQNVQNRKKSSEWKNNNATCFVGNNFSTAVSTPVVCTYSHLSLSRVILILSHESQEKIWTKPKRGLTQRLFRYNKHENFKWKKSEFHCRFRSREWFLICLIFRKFEWIFPFFFALFTDNNEHKRFSFQFIDQRME